MEEAEDFLWETLADGPRPVKEVQRQAEDSCISKATLRRAGSRLQLKRAPQGFKGQWMLSLPTGDQDASQLIIPTS